MKLPTKQINARRCALAFVNENQSLIPTSYDLITG